MRRWFHLGPLGLVLLSFACKSPEEKACETSVRISEAHSAQTGQGDGKTSREHQRGCVDGLRRLREQLRPDEDQWFTYLACIRAAAQMSDQPKCLQPLIGDQAEVGIAPR
jgi:hypothetical protein